MSDVAVTLGADPSGLNAGLSAAQQAVRAAAARMQGAFAPVRDAISNATSGLRTFGAVLGGVSLAALVAGVRGTIQSLDDLNDAADRTGASIEELSALRNTLAPYGTSLDEITAATGRLIKAMADGDDESRGAGEAFRLLGVQTRDAAGNLRPTLDVLHDVASALSQYRDGSSKTALAVAIFGRAGAELLPLLKDLAEATREAATLSTAQAEEAERANKALNRLANNARVLREELVSRLVPALADAADQMNLIARSGGGLWEQFRAMVGPEKYLRELEADLADLQRRRDRLASDTRPLMQRGRDEGLAKLDAEIREIESKLTRIRGAAAIARRSTTELRYGDAGYGPRWTMDSVTEKPVAPSPSRKDSAAESRASRERSALEQIQVQLAKERELSNVEQMRIRTTTGAYREFSAAAKERLMQYAAELDAQQLLEARIKAASDDETEDIRALAELRRTALADIKRQGEELDRAAEKWREIADPAEKYRKQLEEIRRLVATGRLTPQQGISAEFEVQSTWQDELDKAAKPEAPSWLGQVEGGFRSLFDAIREGSISARGVWEGTIGLMGDIASSVLSKLATDWLTSMLVAKLSSIRTALADISASAARAGAAAFASTAAIPVVGPALAPAAGAAAYSGAMSYAGALAATASAAGGFDIPAWANPVTQLHAREMVLPADIAEPARRMFRGGGSGADRPVNLTVQAYDSRDAGRFLIDNRRGVAKSLRRAFRDGNLSR